MDNIEKSNYVCYGCGKDRPCYVECNQKPDNIVDHIEDLRCVLDETNQTSYSWEYYQEAKDG